MIYTLLLPWKSDVILEHPWNMPIFVLSLALLLSIITWVRKKK
jgi:hypothetical protein